MAFGTVEFMRLMQEAHPSDQLKNHCKGAILHQIGHVLGHDHEYHKRKQDMHAKFCKKIVISDYLQQIQ